MYLVVSRWRAKPGKESEFEATAKPLRTKMRSHPGVVMIEAFKNVDHYVVAHGYKDKAAYDAIVQNPTGPFNEWVEQSHLEDVGDWVGSDSGETIDE
jgi:quinol monooxygenase YgiN